MRFAESFKQRVLVLVSVVLATVSFATVGLGAGAPLARAQTVDSNSRLGPVTIVELSNMQKAVSIGGRVLPLPSEPYLAYIHARLGDLFLIAVGQGGNGCPAHFVWLHATPGDVRFSEVFGTCSDLADVSYDSETVRVTIPSMKAGEGKVTFVYDGKGPVRELRADVAASGMAAWDDWTFWVGKHPFKMMEAADMRPRFVALMGRGAYRTALARLAVASRMTQEGDWITGAGGQPHNANVARTAVALNLRDGRLLVATKGEGMPPIMWGHPGGGLPSPIAAIMAMR
ncbi:hypothetical protein N4R57_14975 [Rhodobacteraceae bacterium D3-12]|nr:hypothetical protein N4R57_14975 [Rhodobacteraceae bacterium D3-12]